MTTTAPPGAPEAADVLDLHLRLLDWYGENARDLPWRDPACSPWGVLVSEVMLQQTPVARVLPEWTAWLRRWPEPADLAAEAPGEAVRAWNRLGYPRRALRLHAAAVAIRDEHGGRVPDEHAQLLALPGIGAYTAAAVASFAFRQRHAVVDTNVRRVQARAVTGAAEPAPALTAAETRLAVRLLPDDPRTAARWAVAVMELGALVCTARAPRCPSCPLADRCAWVLAGRPAHDGPARRAQAWAGTDRQVRGKLLAVLRAADGPVGAAELAACWDDAAQRARCLDGLVADGLVEPLEDGRFALPRS
ncbi:A/G-specific adenine glycosylase [Kineococcus sp. T13]|uniref:A/G-specific adenine glycosylase n=1 Tax=Kineococcus vitellinus TaxID=2696565 RepID=UPI001411CA1E|nr:A/G-specific adenine glycosylase [Kineococcus vitellinus]NAZ76858.1 A/G-specific adenine glycosylase [Kineococcus vitellinus]